MATTVEACQDYAGWSPFYVLKISGLPYRFCATVNPYDTTWGASAWTSTGLTVIRGMDVPDDRMTQKLPDLVGGVASAERLRVTLKDTTATDSGGEYRVLGRLFAPGRAVSSSSVYWGTLDDDLDVGDTALLVNTQATVVNWGASGYVYLANETIAYSSASKGGDVINFTISGRNQFPCHASFPATPTYRVPRDDSGVVVPSGGIMASSQPSLMIGRTVALYIGHLEPGSGKPGAEADAACRFIGRITGVNSRDGLHELEMESILDDLKNARVAPNLAAVNLEGGQIILPASARYRSFVILVRTLDVWEHVTTTKFVIEVPAGTYRIAGGDSAGNKGLLETINAKIKEVMSAETRVSPGAIFGHVTFTMADGADGYPRVRAVSSVGVLSDHTPFVSLKHGYSISSLDGDLPMYGSQSLLHVLGFSQGVSEYGGLSENANSGGVAGDAAKPGTIIAEHRPPTFFMVLDNQSDVTLKLTAGSKPGTRFFSNQGDGSQRAWVRLSTGDMLSVVGTADNTITVRASAVSAVESVRAVVNTAVMGLSRYIYVETGTQATVEQVMVLPDPSICAPSSARLLAQLIGSTGSQAGGGIDIFPPSGPGLGWYGIMDTDSWSVSDAYVVPRRIVVDRTTPLKHIMDPILKAHGYMVVWSPEAGEVVLREVTMPSAAAAETFYFTDSNRARHDDRSDSSSDMTSLRTGWHYETGWDATSQKFMGSPVVVNDAWVTAAYGVSNKTEKLEDRTAIAADATRAALTSLIGSRSEFFRYPWTRVRRTVNKRGLLLSPGTIHQVVDATIPNPFTGAMGIGAGDSVYAVLTEVSANLATGDVDAELHIYPRQQASSFGGWSPSGRISYAAASNGWNSGTKTLTFLSHYTNRGASYYDGADFAVGDKVRIQTRDNDGAPWLSQSDEIATISADGQTVTLVTGGFTISTSVESIMVLETYANATSARKSSEVWLGDANNGMIVYTATNKKWS